MLLFRFSVLGFLFVSFHPSRFRSHSRSTGASLFFEIFRLLSAFFRLLEPASDYSAFCPFFSLLPVLPWQRFLRCLFIRFPVSLFPCFPFCFGTQLTAIPFSIRCLASQWLLQRLSLPFGFRPLPLGYRFRFRLLGFGTDPFRFGFPPRTFVCYHIVFGLSTTIFTFCIYLFNNTKNS